MIDTIALYDRLEVGALPMQKTKHSIIFLSLVAAFVLPVAGRSAEGPDKPNKLGNVSVKRDLSGYALENAQVYVLPVDDAIMADMAFKFHRLCEHARAGKPDAIVVDLNTPGGELGAMKQMRDDIMEFDCPVISYVNDWAISAGSLLALASDAIVMAEGSKIGAALPITSTGESVGGGSEKVEEKFLSFTRAEWRSTAKARGHDPDLAQRMTDPRHEKGLNERYPGLVVKDELLTLDYDQATSVGLAVFVASDMDELFEKMGYEDPVLPVVELSWSEKLAGFLVKPAVSGMLMLIAFAAFYVEFKSPGVGVPLAIGLLAICLFFWGSLLADLSSYWELALFVAGLILLAAEVFVIPGFGIAGILGLLCIISSLLFSMSELPAPDSVFAPINLDVMRAPLYTLTGVLVASIPMFWILTAILPKTPMFSSLVTDPNQTDTALAEDEMRNAPKKYVGLTGEVISDLRPAGHAMLNGERTVVVTRGEFIEKGTRVRVIDEQGNEVIVVPEQQQG